MSAHSFKFAALVSAAWLVLPAGIAAAQESEGQSCGGFTQVACPEGYSCADDPSDDCDPAAGGAQCSGTCTAGSGGAASSDGSKGKSHCNYGDPNLQYVSKDPNQCAAVTFICEDGFEGFFNDCGCGCRPIM
jgi:hypothetical protein